VDRERSRRFAPAASVKSQTARSRHLARETIGHVDEDARVFMRELTRRHERATEAMVRRLDAGTAALGDFGEGIRALAEEIRELAEEIRAQRREFIEESRAQRTALFRILDRLDGGSAEAGA
jgi:hypothetical protein